MALPDKLEQLAATSAALSPCPAPERLAAFALGQLRGADQLSLDAHVRRCPLCASDVALARPPDLTGEWPLGTRPPRRRSFLARLVELPLAAGLRGETARAPRRYEAAALGVDLTIRADGDLRRLTGIVLRDQVPASSCTVTLRRGRRSLKQSSGDDGYFTFEDLLPGHYTLRVDDGRVRIEIPDLEVE